MNIARSILLYIAWFFVCMIFVVTVLQFLPDWIEALFALIAPFFAVRWHNKRRREKSASNSEISESRYKRVAGQPDNFRPDEPFQADRRAVERGERTSPLSAPTRTRSLTSNQPNQDNRALIAAGRAARADLAIAAAKYAKPQSEDPASYAEDDIMPIFTNQSVGDHMEISSAIRSKSGWVPSGETVVVAGRHILGMVYVGTPPSVGESYYRQTCRAYIDPALSVASLPADPQSDDLGYWPSYSDISARCRATYLDWLADGATSKNINVGYVFLYFYGLERRLFVDKPERHEQALIIAEAERLLALFGENHSIRRYLGEFVETASIVFAREGQITPIYESRSWELPLPVRLKIGSTVRDGERVSAEWILSWYLCSGYTNLRTPARRCTNEFRALFLVLHEQKYPGGQKVRKPKGQLQYRYRAASSEFDLDLKPTVDGHPVPDITTLAAPLNRAQLIADEASDRLDKYSRFLGRNSDCGGSIEAHALLPIEIRDQFPCAGMDALENWAKSIIMADGLVAVAELIEKLEGAAPDRIGKRQLTDAADALAGLAIGMAPDPRFALRAPKADEVVVLFDLGEPVLMLEEVSDGYQQALLEMALGSFIAHADGEVVEAEHLRLVELATTAPVANDQERQRLQANRFWFEAVKPDMNMLRRRLKLASAEDSLTLRAAAIAMAHADMAIVPEEVAGIEKIYTALGLDRSLVYADLHARDITDTPVSVRAAIVAAGGEFIPEDTPPSAVTLDMSKIAEIRSNTDRVSSVLGEIFGADAQGSSPKDVPVPDSSFEGLDTIHSVFVKDLIAEMSWSADKLAGIAAVNKLPLAGMIETVNEWSFETHGEMLIDDYDGYEILPEIAEAIRHTMNGGK
tara:strand:- start:10348 stop:12939 length:2592 start_codon:yes stop_codon:yes gene_type:complete